MQENLLATHKEGEMVTALQTADVADNLGPSQDAPEGVPTALTVVFG